MANTGWIYAGTGATGTPSGGIVAWTFPTRITANDNSYTSTGLTSSGSGYSEILRAKSFSLGIPTGVTIDGISIRYGAQGGGIGISSNTEQLINSSSAFYGTGKGGRSWTTGTETMYTLGSSVDLWGGTQTEAIVTSPNWGFGLDVGVYWDAKFGANSGLVDYIQAIVYYTLSAPAAPSACTITSITSTTATITWNDNSSTEDLFRLERSLNGGGFTFLKNVSANSTSTTSTVSEGNSYQYRIRAERTGTSPSAYSTSGTSSAPPKDPTGIAISNITSSSLRVTWTDNSSVENNYDIDVQINSSGSWVNESTLAANTTLYDDSGLTEANVYEYRVRATDTSANSNFIYSDAEQIPLADPSDCTIDLITFNQANISWTDNSAVEDNYKIERKVNGGSWVPLATLAAGTTSYTDSPLTEMFTYAYRVKVVKSGIADSGYSTSLTETAPIRPKGGPILF